MSRKIVVALGGNAILSSDPSAQAQQEALVETAKHLVKLIKNGDDLIITHGNGPQVGNLLLQHLAANSEKNPAFPLDSLVAMTEGSIGYWLQNALQNASWRRNWKGWLLLWHKSLWDKNDPAFVNLSKPIGPFYSEEEAKAEAEKIRSNFQRMLVVAGVVWLHKTSGYQRNQYHQYFVERRVKSLCCCGGGIPVVKRSKW